MYQNKSRSLSFARGALIAAALVGCGQSVDGPSLDELENGGAIAASVPQRRDPAQLGGARILPVRSPAKAAAPVNTAATAHLNYYGGHVISNVKVEIVYWGNNVNSTIKSSMKSWYQTVVNSAHMDWLSEYNTNITAVGGQAGTNQQIGRGTVDQEITIAPTKTSGTVTDDDIKTELTNQINSGKLPRPDANTIYQFYFPPGITVALGSDRSCSTFCAYHNTLTYSGANTFYSVMPDVSGCLAGCGGGASLMNAISYASSHELIEAVTDAEVGLATTNGPPLAWYDTSQGEIGDICNAQSGTIPGTNAVVQAEWSNCENKCIITRTAGVTCGGGTTGSVNTAITAPAAGATLSGTTSVSASASTSFTGATISKVDFYRSGTLIGTATTSPYTVSWNTTAVSDGSYSLTSKATDSKGNTGTSPAVNVTVKNSVTTTCAEKEPNNSTTAANALSLSCTSTSGDNNATSDTDYFKIDLPAGKTLKATLKPEATADFDLYIYNSAGSLIGSSENTTGVADTVSVKNTGTQTFTRYIEVRYYSGSKVTGNKYTVSATVN